MDLTKGVVNWVKAGAVGREGRQTEDGKLLNSEPTTRMGNDDSHEGEGGGRQQGERRRRRYGD
jgi:hypothetical protein